MFSCGGGVFCEGGVIEGVFDFYQLDSKDNYHKFLNKWRVNLMWVWSYGRHDVMTAQSPNR